MYEKIQNICKFLRKEDQNSDIYIDKESKTKYETYKNWLIKNGAIFDKNIDFPFTYGPFHKIGCKSISDINENEALILIPRSLIIYSEDLHYIDKYIKDIIDELSENDMPIIYLTLYLYLEKDNPNSFFKPYIDILFLDKNNNNKLIYDKFDEKNLNELNDEITLNSFEKMINNIEEIYNLIKQCDKFLTLSKNDFANCYFQVISQKIDLNDNTNNAFLVPLIDLFLQDSSYKLRYEIYDSENMIFKYTSILNDNKDSIKNMQTTKSKFLPHNKPTYNKLLPFIVDYNEDNSDDSGYEKEKNKIKINNNDYFSLALSKNEKILKNNIICDNKCQLCNKKLLKKNGFCLLYNRNDYISIKFKINRGELLTDKYLENIFGDKYQTENDDPIYNILKIKIEFNNISTDLLKYFRFMYFHNTQKKAKKYFNYHFNLEIETNIINSSIDFLKNKLKMMEINYSFDDDFKKLENELYNKKESNYFKSNILIYRISQKIILKNQIDLLSYILKIMTKHKKNILGYNNIFDYIEKEKYVNDYDKEEYTRMKILRFIAYMSKNIDLK